MLSAETDEALFEAMAICEGGRGVRGVRRSFVGSLNFVKVERRVEEMRKTHHVPLLLQRRMAVLGPQVRYVRLVDLVAFARLVPVRTEPVPLDFHFKARLDARVASQLAHVCG